MTDPPIATMKTQTGKELKTKTIICDVDGCLADWNTAFRALLESLHGPRTVQPLDEAMKRWDWHRALGYTNREVDEAWDKVDHQWWYDIEAYPTTPQAVVLLSDYFHGLEVENPGTHVYYVTGRYATARHATVDWLQGQGACCPSVVCTSRKAMLAGAFAIDGPVAAVEDKPSMIREYGASTHVNPIIIVDQPYNQEENLGDPRLYAHCAVIRVSTALAAVEILASMWGLKIEKPQTAEAAEAEDDPFLLKLEAETPDKNVRD